MSEYTQKSGSMKKHTWYWWIFRSILPVIIIAIGVKGAKQIVESKKQPQKKKAEVQAPYVNAQKCVKSDEKMVIAAMGTIIPARTLQLKARVSGEIVEMDSQLVQGGYIKAGNTVVKIDPSDYELALEQAAQGVAQATYNLKIEEGQQKVAKREVEILKMGDLPESELNLTLRKPHLKLVKASMEAAQAQLKQAELNLARTNVKAPFNAIVQSETVEKGSLISANEGIATLIGTDSYWVQLSVPLDELSLIHFPSKENDKGSKVAIYSTGVNGGKSQRDGYVIRLLPSLDIEGRMARILVEISDPLCLKKENHANHKLLLDEYVRAEIAGEVLEKVTKVDREYIHNYDELWILNDEARLEIRTINPVWKDATYIYVKDEIKEGEFLIVSNLATPVDGMDLRISGSNSNMKEEK